MKKTLYNIISKPVKSGIFVSILVFTITLFFPFKEKIPYDGRVRGYSHSIYINNVFLPNLYHKYKEEYKDYGFTGKINFSLTFYVALAHSLFSYIFTLSFIHLYQVKKRKLHDISNMTSFNNYSNTNNLFNENKIVNENLEPLIQNTVIEKNKIEEKNSKIKSVSLSEAMYCITCPHCNSEKMVNVSYFFGLDIRNFHCWNQSCKNKIKRLKDLITITPDQNVVDPFWSGLISITGRLGLADYFLSFLTVMCIWFICLIPVIFIMPYYIITSIAFLFFIILIAPITIRRLHDIGISGFWYILIFITYTVD